MIYVDRNVVPVPLALNGAKSRGVRETERNIEHFNNNETHKQTFTAYKDPTVVEALSMLFHRKCAYCEVLMAGQQPGDVDHYRPKASAIVYEKDGERVATPGYFWLAANWDNLLPSCVFCNRPNTLDIAIEDEEERRGKGAYFPQEHDAPSGNLAKRSMQRRRAGKHCDFPLVVGSPRREFPASLDAAEQRLLLNPCEDDPRDHLKFTRDGFVLPVQKQDGVSQMGKKTIEVCALNRAELLQLRQAVALELEERLMEVILDLTQHKAPRDSDMRAIERAMSARSPFSAFIRQYVAERFREHITGI